jgi:hypothetical protein
MPSCFLLLFLIAVHLLAVFAAAGGCVVEDERNPLPRTVSAAASVVPRSC